MVTRSGSAAGSKPGRQAAEQTEQSREVPEQRTDRARPAEHAAAQGTAIPRMLAVLRLSVGFVFAWAFLDKLFGFGYATPSENAWINGGSPTEGFLGGVAVGPFESMFHSWAGAGWADWLFMLGLAGVGFAVLAGVALRLAAVSGSVMMLLMWAAEWPLAMTTSAGEPSMSSNPFMDYHVLYALVLVLLAIANAGVVWGLGGIWARQSFVQRYPWLR